MSSTKVQSPHQPKLKCWLWDFASITYRITYSFTLQVNKLHVMLCFKKLLGKTPALWLGISLSLFGHLLILSITVCVLILYSCLTLPIIYFTNELSGPSYDLVFAAILFIQISQKKQEFAVFITYSSVAFTAARCLLRVPDNELRWKELLWMSCKFSQPAWFDCIALVETRLFKVRGCEHYEENFNIKHINYFLCFCKGQLSLQPLLLQYYVKADYHFASSRLKSRPVLVGSLPKLMLVFISEKLINQTCRTKSKKWPRRVTGPAASSAFPYR